jgi:hypothetical protein
MGDTLSRTSACRIVRDFDFPGRKTARLMRVGSIYISIANLGSVNDKLFQRSPWKKATLPIRIRHADLRPFEGTYSPSEAVRWVVVKRRALLLLVAFGRQNPTEAQLARANRVLSTFRLSQTR